MLGEQRLLLHLTSPAGGATVSGGIRATPTAGTLFSFRSMLANGTEDPTARHWVEPVSAESAEPRLDIMLSVTGGTGMLSSLFDQAQPFTNAEGRKAGPLRRAFRMARRLLFAAKLGATGRCTVNRGFTCSDFRDGIEIRTGSCTFGNAEVRTALSCTGIIECGR